MQTTSRYEYCVKTPVPNVLIVPVHSAQTHDYIHVWFHQEVIAWKPRSRMECAECSSWSVLWCWSKKFKATLASNWYTSILYLLQSLYTKVTSHIEEDYYNAPRRDCICKYCGFKKCVSVLTQCHRFPIIYDSCQNNFWLVPYSKRKILACVFWWKLTFLATLNSMFPNRNVAIKYYPRGTMYSHWL